MLYFKIAENTVQGKAFANFVKTLPFIEIVEKEFIESKYIDRNEFLEDVKISINQAKDMHSGKMKKRILKDTFSA
jgi:hypothetical protein